MSSMNAHFTSTATSGGSKSQFLFRIRTNPSHWNQYKYIVINYMWYIYMCVCVAYCSTENAIGSLHGHEHRRVSVPGRLPLQRPVRPSNIAGLDSRISWASECPADRALWGKDWKDLQGWSWLINHDQSTLISYWYPTYSNIIQPSAFTHRSPPK
jgi:hypothetical protein